MFTLKELFEQYSEKFNQNFPIFAVSHLDEAEIEVLIKSCLESGTPYTPPHLADDAVY